MNTAQNPSAKIKPDLRFLFSHPAHFISLGFGSGLSPIMPGTAGTLLGWFLFYILTAVWPSYFTQLTWSIIVILGFILGVWTSTKSENALNSPDDGSIVWDEVIGIWLVLLVLMPTTLITACWAFFLFRLFDMTKPPPIRQIDARLKGGLGVMLDDILAAGYALIAYALIVFVSGHFGLTWLT
ncbi:MAG: phosphatidylglycerophosphatase A [Betaproteobacteria bacterium]|nr:phosphatidylglycerophosphatase A [Betaproteobacteria bacterium]